MKVKVRKLIMLGLSTVLAGASLATSTYAWFKINETAQVQDIRFQVVSGLGFEVSVDGEHFNSDLNLDQMRKAVVSSYNSSLYKVLPYDSDGNDAPDRLYKYNGVKFVELSDSDAEHEIDDVLKKIKLLPTTSSDGNSFIELFEGIRTPSSGRFMEFGVYFRTTSRDESDNQKYDIYLNGYEGLDERGNQILGTVFTSKETNVKLSAAMKAARWSFNQEYSYNSGETISVYSSNAARISTTSSTLTHFDEKYILTSDTEYDSEKQYYTFSITDGYQPFEGTEFEEDVNYYEFVDAYDAYVVDAGSSIIYEINDTDPEHAKYDFGSYATNYTETPDGDGAYSKEYYLNSSDCNAMYNYYNNLRSDENSLSSKLPDYEEIPTNIIRALPTQQSSELYKASSIGEANDSKYYPITTLESGADAKLVTFRVWIEGWDADCFDGLSDSIDMRLAFCSKRVY